MIQTLFAIIPIAWLILSLLFFGFAAILLCLIGLVITIVTSIFAFDFKVTDSLTAALEGAMMGFYRLSILL